MEEKVAGYSLLNAAEREVVEAHILQCPACLENRRVDTEINRALEERAKARRAALQDNHLSPEAILGYALQKEGIRRNRWLEIEGHLNRCAECQREVWLVQDTEKEWIEPKRPALSSLRRLIFSPTVVLALAGIVLILLPYLAFRTVRLRRQMREMAEMYQGKVADAEQQIEGIRKDYARLDQERRGLLQPQIGAPSFERLDQAVRSGRSDGPIGRPIEFRFSRDKKFITRIISLRPSQHLIYEVQIYHGDKPVWADSVQLPGPILEFRLHEQSLAAGQYVLRIYEKNEPPTLVAIRPLLVIKD